MRSILTILFLLLSAICATAQSHNPYARKDAPSSRSHVADSSPEVRFVDLGSVLQGDSILVRFDLKIRGAVISSDESLCIIPVYEEDGRRVYFPTIMVNGSKRAPYYRREQSLLSHEEYLSQMPYEVLTLDPDHELSVSYSFALRLDADMRGKGGLIVSQIIEDCCHYREVGRLPLDLEVSPSTSVGSSRRMPEHRPIEPSPDTTSQQRKPRPVAATKNPVVSSFVTESNVTFIRPRREVVKERNEYLTLHINYIVDRYNVDPSYANNASELSRVDELFRPLSSLRERYAIQGVNIKGYASPEGQFDYNRTLSQRRADGFKQYLSRHYGLTSGLVTSQGFGEDWDGLRNSVNISDMPYRKEVLSIIDHVGIFQGREKMLMDLAGGVPYRYMLEKFYPSLRRMDMEVRYVVRSFELEEAETVIELRPQDLSQEEIYEVARHRNTTAESDKNRSEYGKEYEVAAKYFSSDATANINASSAALVRGDLDAAWRYLSRVLDTPAAYNNIGVYYWMRGDLDRARQYFKKALNVKSESDKARYNLNLLDGQYLGN